MEDENEAGDRACRGDRAIELYMVFRDGDLCKGQVIVVS